MAEIQGFIRELQVLFRFTDGDGFYVGSWRDGLLSGLKRGNWTVVSMGQGWIE